MCDTPDSQAPEQQQRVKKLDKLVSRLTNTYYILKKVDKSTAGVRAANEQKTLARRKLIRRRRSTTTGHLTDASESSFDSSLIDCFKGLATLNDVDPNHHPHVNATSKRRRCTSQSLSNAQRYFFKRTTTTGHNCHAPAVRHNRSTVKRLQHTAQNKHTNSHHHQTTNMVDMSDLCMNGSCGVATTSKNIELFLNESQGCTVKRKKMHMQRHDHDRTRPKRMDIDKPVNSSSYMSDVNDQSSVNDDETDVDVEADDEQSDWPVNEPSLKVSSKTMSIDDTDECSDYDTRRLLTNNNDDSFACPNFPDSLKNIMHRQFKKAKRKYL